MAANKRKYSQEYVDTIINKYNVDMLNLQIELKKLHIEKNEWQELAIDCLKKYNSTEQLADMVPQLLILLAKERSNEAH
jgi:hypothetical protein